MKAADLAYPSGRVMLYTNVLLAVTDRLRAGHREALGVFRTWPGAGTGLCISGQIVREYIAVATRPVDANGLGLTVPAALSNVRAFRQRAMLVFESSAGFNRLMHLLADADCADKRVHDANIVATMLAHGIS
jgi:predicted nucleic acid-binding protein